MSLNEIHAQQIINKCSNYLFLYKFSLEQTKKLCENGAIKANEAKKIYYNVMEGVKRYNKYIFKISNKYDIKKYIDVRDFETLILFFEG